MKSEKNKYIIIFIFVFCISFIPLYLFYNKSYEELKENSRYKDSIVDNILFEGVGNYAFATAGSNNAYRGSSLAVGYKWIIAPPDETRVSYDWSEVETKILEETGLSTITNISGSYLNLDGTLHKAMLSMLASQNANLTGYTGRILIIKPNGTYSIINYQDNNWVDTLDITEILRDSGKGWYYVSYLDAGLIPQCAWAITAVYESSSLPTTYIKFINVNKSLSNGAETTIDFDSKFELQNDFQLIGVITAGGISGFPNYGEYPSLQTSEDEAYAILNDGTEYQLYDRNDNHFTNRTSTDFANDIFGTERNHSQAGGELDIYDETLSSDYFNGKNITGYRFIKTGTNIINVSIVGLAQTVTDSNITVSTNIIADSKFKEESEVSVQSTIKNNLSNGYCFYSYNNNITNTVDSSFSNLKNIKAYLNGSTELEITYDSDNNLLVIPEIHKLTCTDEITISFDATINSNIKNSIKNHQYIINSKINNNYSLIDLDTLSEEEQEKYSELKANKSATDQATSPEYLVLTINHYQKDTSTKLTPSSTINLYYGETYTTTAASNLLTNYEVMTPSNYSGTAYSSTSINYYYQLKKANVTIKYLEKDTNKSLATDEVLTYNYTDSYSISAKDITNYSFSGEKSTITGTISGDTEIIFYYTRKTATLTINHYIEGTSTSLVDTETTTVYWGDTYSTFPSTNINSNYEYSSVNGNASGTVSGNIIITYYYKKKTSTLIVKYLEYDTNKELSTSTTTTVYYGDIYTTSISSSVPNNYELLKKTDNYTGQVSTDKIEVIYYYQKKDSNLETSIEKKGPTEITSKEEILDYTITYNANVTDYIGNGTITIIDTLPYAIDESLSDIDGGTYNATNKTITWTESWNNINTYNNLGTKEITKNIKLVYTEIKGTDRILINSVKGSISLDNNSRDIESQTSTEVKISGNIIIHYYLKGTKIEVIEDKKITDLVGESYFSTSEELEGYTIIKPDTEEYIITEETQEVVYEYEKIKVHIITQVDGTGGTISGDEDIDYGDNSTQGNIVIKPLDGYIISGIIINGERLEISEQDQDGIVLGNFIEVKEDIIISVTFEKKELTNPSTGMFISYIAISLVVIISTILLFYIKKHHNKLLKI